MRKRLIDEIPDHPPTFQSKVSILVLNAPRTGSSSLAIALEQLGYKVYSAMHHGFAHGNHFSLWSEAVDAKYFNPNHQLLPFRRRDWDKIFGDFEVVRGLQPAFLAEDLIAAYPEAKVLIYTRDVEEWASSMERTVCRLMGWKTMPVLTWLEGGTKRKFYENIRRNIAAWSSFDSWTSVGKAFDREEMKKSYSRRHENIHELVPPDRLLDFRPQDGWVPLCKFLDRNPPQDKAYPDIMGQDELDIFIHEVWWDIFWKAVRNVGMVVGLGVFPLVLSYISHQ